MRTNPFDTGIDLSALDSPYSIAPDQVAFYRKHAFIKLKDVFSPEVLDYFGDAITSTVMELKKDKGPLETRDTYGRAFIQVANLWTKSDVVRQLVFSRRLGRIAAELMGVDGVRLYHDQALYKEPGGGITPWHADQYYWPLATNHCTTAWIPLQATPLEMGPLEFSVGSHQLAAGRELKISDESESTLQKLLSDESFDHVVEPFDAGEISFHAGWLYHRAGPNTTGVPRKAMTVIYMDRDMRLKEPEHEHQVLDRDVWCPGAEVGRIIDSPLNPVIYQTD
ncbi:MAG: phytanoyl-CoA dioxygenase [Rhodothermales bacterium]|nr:phytanoyl-CoA dioxygenase [Rhodothermales bacterium]